MPDDSELTDETPEEKAKREKDEAELKKTVVEVTETNKKIDDVYDERMRILEMKRKLVPTDEQAEEEHQGKILMLKERYEDLRSRISQARRKGKDPIIADLMTRNIPAKIKIADATREKRDFDQVEIMLKNVEAELEEALKEVEINVKMEIEQRLKSDFQKATGKVEEVEED
ncbi:hypothetical protein JW826_05055 [Candidatus Woesearchaeota archaeon]|nr:hypothetical protein [Candidatus Woesearchaeota archaeon]